MSSDVFPWHKSIPINTVTRQVKSSPPLNSLHPNHLGTGTVLFSDSHSYMRAVAAGAIDIKCDCFHKLVSAHQHGLSNPNILA